MRRNAATAAASGDNGSFPVIPTEAEPLGNPRGKLSEAKWRDLIMSARAERAKFGTARAVQRELCKLPKLALLSEPGN